MLMFERPIPGQSLTAESRSQAFERPPEITDPIEALDIHIENLSKEGAMEDVLYFLEFGVDLVTLVQGILRSAVMEGIHSIDISLIIAPVLHEHIKGFADVAKLDYDEGFDNQEGKKALAYKRDVARAKKMMKKLEEEGKAEVSVPEPMEEPKPEIEKQEPDKSGLMARM
jgi:hypothetical protein|tara:strand:- start:1111 stop:1620 length:510 start_codon:yes stop_codon:yes gene_type:complete